MSNLVIAPIRQSQRIKLIDAIRGIALLGILLMNSMAQSQAHFFYDKMDLRQSLTGLNFFAWGTEMILFEGTMRGLFSILFGAGTLLLLSRLIKTKKGLEPADIFYRRMLWLLVFGLINAFIFLWPGDILYPYALCGLLLFPFRNLSVKNLLWIAFFFLAIGTYRDNSDLYQYKNIITKGQAAEVVSNKKVKLTEVQEEDLGKYKDFKEKQTSAGIMKRAQKEEKKIQGQGYVPLFKYFLDINMMIESTIFYESYWWDILLFLFIGMALFKSGFLAGKKSNKLYITVAVTGIVVGTALNYYFQKTQYDLRFDQYLFVQKWRFAYYELRRVFQTMGYLSLIIILYKVAPFRKILNVFAPVGQMAFTNYLSQSIITSIIFYGMGWFGKLQRYEVYYIVGGIWIFQIAASNIWIYYFRFGPFEWLWRSLTYMKKQPMKKQITTIESEEDTDEEIPLPALG
ncbi:MAG: hypothetical protein JWN76_2493 [Chitinophagaceae bacterium]|nr:hypothetical protein [Chitinophagaceae bacterium]